MTQQGLSARAHDRILKVDRTVADLEDCVSSPTQAHRRSDSVPQPGPDVLGVESHERSRQGLYGVPDGAPAISHENPRNEDAVRSMAGSTVE
jgi:hypothetical protein